MKSELQRNDRIKELKIELNAVDQSISRSDLQHKDRSTLAQKRVQLREQLQEMFNLNSTSANYFGEFNVDDKLQLAPLIYGEWLPRNAVFALIDLMVAMLGRPKGVFKECGRRIQSGLGIIQGMLHFL